MNDENERIAHLEEMLDDMKKERDTLRQRTKELMVAFVTAHGDRILVESPQKWQLFLPDRDILQVAPDDVLNISYSNERMGNVYEVIR